MQAAGRVGAGPLLRSQAANGDLVLVTGTLGDAGAALALLQRSQFQRNNPHHLALLARLERPTPRVNAGMRLAGIANSALDVSDGLSGDVRHLFRGVLGAQITPTSLPLSQALSASFSAVEAREFALGAGDDYELCFTVSPDNLDKALLACEQANVAATVVGKMVDNGGCLELTEPCGETPVGAKSTHGFQHF